MNNIVTLLEQDQYVADGTIDSWYNNFHVWLSRADGDQLINGSTCSSTELETYSELFQTSKTELFAKVVNGLRPLNLFVENSILDVYLNSKYACGISNTFFFSR